MLIKKLLVALPLSPAPKQSRKTSYTAGATVHNLERCGQVLTVDVYENERLCLRFFSDGKNYITWAKQSCLHLTAPGWTKRNPFGGVYCTYPDIFANKEAIEAVMSALRIQNNYYSEARSIAHAISAFITDIGWQKRQRAWETKARLMKQHFAMFPEYPADLAAFCEEHVFSTSAIYISKLEKGTRHAECRHCGDHFTVGREAKPGGTGTCPQCGKPVIYRAKWSTTSHRDKAKICIAYKVDGQLLLRYTDVERTFYPDQDKPTYHFSDCFKTLFLAEKGKQTEYAYWWGSGPYCYGADWRRLPNGSGKYDPTYVYTNNLRDVFGPTYCNVDLQAGLSGLHRPFSFRRLLDNLKNKPQAEYLFKLGLPMLAASDIPSAEAKGFTELLGVSRQYLPILRETAADCGEIQAIASNNGWVSPEDVRLLCSLSLDYEAKNNLIAVLRYNKLGRSLRYVLAQKRKATGPLKRRKLPYFLLLYRDYLDMAYTLDSDMTKRAVLEPRDLKERHDLLAERVNELKDELDNIRFQKAMDNGLYWWAQPYAKGDYRVVYPQKRSDLTTEGQRLNHCVGGKTYFENHIAGRRMVFFIHKASQPDKPYFTAEIDVEHGRILQLYGFSDCSAPKEVRGFVEGFVRAVGKWRNSAEQSNAA